MSKEALGKGRAAIFEGLSPASSHQLPEASSQTQVASNHLQETSDHTPATSYQPPIDESILVQALAEAKESPKITIFSPKVAAVLRYKQLTTIRYSFSTEARERLEQTVKDAYPDLWEAVEKALAKK
jgi:hypothetical protein